MKKTHALNWISAARSVSPAFHIPSATRSTLLGVRPRLVATRGGLSQIAAD